MDLFRFSVKERSCCRMMSPDHNGHFHLNQSNCNDIQVTLLAFPHRRGVGGVIKTLAGNLAASCSHASLSAVCNSVLAVCGFVVS